MALDTSPAMVVVPIIAITIGWAVNTWLRVRQANVERIVTDSGYRLTHEIEALRSAPPAPQGAKNRSAMQ
ncbi:MAG: hypothetical protein ACKVOL_15115 [Novosphingobium sp.]